MAAYWIDIEDLDGVKLGPGPITTAISWNSTAKLDRAGTFSFTMPAGDDRADLVRPKRVAHCWTVDGGILQSVGAGIVDTITIAAGADGAPLMTVSGDDLLRQLTYRSVGELKLSDSSYVHPAELFMRTLSAGQDFDDEYDTANGGAGYDGIALASDLQVGDATTEETITLDQATVAGTGKLIYIKYPVVFNEIVFVLGGTKNGITTSVIQYEYYNAEDGEWQTLAVEDGTITGTTPFAKSGTVSFSGPQGWGPAAGEPCYKVRFYDTTADTGAIDFADISVHLDEPTPTPLAEVMPYAPDGWALDTVNGYSDIEAATEFGDNLLSNASFETLTSSGTPDVFTGWDNIVAGAQDIQQAGGAQSGSYCLEFTSDADDSNPYIYQTVACDADVDYRLTYWTKGDGTHQAAHLVSVSQDSGTTYYQLTAIEDSGVTAATWTRITRDITAPAGTTHIRVWFVGPYDAVGTAYIDNVSLRQRFGGEVMEEFAGESVLSALVTVAEQTGEHFTLSPNGREVLWLRKDAPDSGVRAIGGIEGVAARDNNKICLITDLTEVHNAYELASRVYPFGGGVGSDRVTLADCTRAAPTGYTLSTTDNYLKRDAAETELGRIDRIQNWADVNAYSSAISHRQFASNQLFDRAYEWLSTHSATNTARNSSDPVISYDTFTRANGAALGSTETTGPDGYDLDAYAWTEDTYSISGNTALNTPALGSDELGGEGAFAAAGSWSAGTGWTIGSGVATHDGGAGDITQDVLTAGKWYRCDWTISAYTDGSAVPVFGSGTLGRSRRAAGTFIDTYLAADVQAGIMGGTDSTFSVDNVTYKEINLADMFAVQETNTAEVSIDVTMPARTQGTQTGVVLRLNDATTPTEFIIVYQTFVGGSIQAVEIVQCTVAGGYETLGSWPSTYTANQVLRARVEGGVVTVSVLAAAGVDGAEGAETRLGSCYTSVLTGTLHGLFSTQAGNTFDNVKITQLDAAGYDVPRAYRLTVAKLNRLLLPGYTVRVQYQKRIGDYVVFDIDENMHVLGSTVRIDDGGLRTVALEVATVRAPILTDADYIANEIKQARYARSRTQGAQGLNDGGGGIAYAMGVRDGRIVNIARQTPVADGTYSSVTVVNGVVTAGS